MQLFTQPIWDTDRSSVLLRGALQLKENWGYFGFKIASPGTLIWACVEESGGVSGCATGVHVGVQMSVHPYTQIENFFFCQQKSNWSEHEQMIPTLREPVT